MSETIHGPDLNYYLRHQKVRLNLNITAQEFFAKYSDCSIYDTLTAQREQSGGSELQRVLRCLMEQRWYETVVHEIVGFIAVRLGLKRPYMYSWEFVREPGTSDWTPRVTLKGEVQPCLDDEDDAGEPFMRVFDVPAPVVSNRDRSLRPWSDFLIPAIRCAALEKLHKAAQEEVSRAEKSWHDHLIKHPH